MNTIYLDYAAATPLMDKVVAAMKPYLQEKFYNPSATYLAAKSVRADLESARSNIAYWLGARPSEIVFTAGGTEANNLAIKSVMDKYRTANVVVGAIEHDSILKPAKEYAYREANVRPDGLVNLSNLKSKIDDNTAIVSLSYANNEIGTIQPIKQASRLIQDIRTDRKKRGIKTPLFFHTDACQAPNYLDLHVARLGVDLMTINAGKIYGPKQCGALFVKAGTNLWPQILGGGQENGMRSGTENVANIVGFAAALEAVQDSRHAEADRLAKLQNVFLKQLNEEIPQAVINGTVKHRVPNNIHVTLPGQDNERLMMALDEKGVHCAVGSACSASSDEPSHVLKAIGLNDNQARASLRFSMGRGTKETDITKTIKTLANLLT